MMRSNVSNEPNELQSKLETLREAINDDDRPLQERKDAAEYAVRLMVEAVPIPSADDAEVVRLQQPHPRNTELEIFAADMADQILGYRFTGNSLKEAQRMVLERHQTRALLSVVMDDTAHRLERLAACQAILDDAHPQGHWHRNGYSAEKLLLHIKSPDGVDYWGRQWEPGARPPRELRDVWD